MTSSAGTLTGMAIVNTSEHDAVVTLTGYDAAGKTEAADGTARSLQIRVPAGQQVSRLLEELYGAESARILWVQATSSADGLAGFFLYLDGSDTFFDGADLPPSATQIVFNQVRDSGGFGTELNLVNPGTQAASVQLQLFGAGPEPWTRQVVLAAKGALRANAATLFGISSITGGAFVTATADVAIAGMEFVRTEGGDLLGLTARPGTEQLRALFFPQMAVLGSWSTTLGLVNSSSSPAIVTLSAYRPDGTLYGTANLKNNPVTRSLNAGSGLQEDVEAMFGFAGSSALDGWIKVESTSDSLNGYVSYGTGRSVAAVASASDGATNAVFSHIATIGSFFTGVAALNPGSLAANVRFVALRPDGQVLGVHDLVLQPGQRLSNLIQNLIPQSAGQAGGMVWVRSDQPIYLMELFGTANTLANVPSQSALATFRPDASLSALRMNPPLAPVEVGKTQLFQLQNGGGSFSWKINGITGGNSLLGTISSTGVYRAPTSQPAPQTMTVTAETVSQIAGGSVDVLKKSALVAGLGVVQSVAYLGSTQKLYAAELASLSGSQPMAGINTSGVFEVTPSGAKTTIAEFAGEVINKMIAYTGSDSKEYLLMAGKATGSVYRLNPVTKEYIVVAKGLKQPSALVVDPATGDLLVAEADKITVIGKPALESTVGLKTDPVEPGLPPIRRALFGNTNSTGMVGDPCTGRIFVAGADGSILQYDQRTAESRVIVVGLKNPGQMVGLLRAGVSCPLSLQLLVLERGLDRVSIIIPGDPVIHPWAPANGSTDIAFVLKGAVASSDGLLLVELSAGATKGLAATSGSQISFFPTPGVYNSQTTNPTASDVEQVVLRPNSVKLTRGARITFTANVKGAKDARVTWSATGGEILTIGLYTAPAATGVFKVKATSVADPKKYAEAIVTVEAVSISLSPTLASIVTGATQAFTATVTGSSNTNVNWSILTAGGGTISGTGLYTAPLVAGTYTLRATSEADPEKFADASVTVTDVVVGIDPPSVALTLGATQQFAAAVSGTPNTVVGWSVVTAGGGSITPSGLYTAPAVPGTYRVRATALADSRKFAESVVTVFDVQIAIDPPAASMLSGTRKQFTAIVEGAPNKEVSWLASAGSISNSGMYTAPETAGSQTIRVTSVADRRKFADASVSVADVNVAVQPSAVNLIVGSTQQFTAAVSGGVGTDVVWSVTTSGGGSISASGLYTAPVTPGTYRVRAVSVADSRKFAEAAITVTEVLVTIDPASRTLLAGSSQQFAATVTGSSDTRVKWSASAGTITDAGLYTAPDEAGAQTVRATALADSRYFADAAVKVETISVVITPSSGVTVPDGLSLQFSAVVEGTSESGVVWSVVTANGGTISSSGLYTAPAAAGAYGVRAVSVADPRRSAEVTVIVESASVVMTAPAPGSTVLDGQTLQFTARVDGASNGAVTWSVVTPGGGTISPAGLYTAPGTAGTYVIQAASAADPRKSAQTAVNVEAVSVAVTPPPSGSTVLDGQTLQYTARVDGTSNGSVAWSVVTANGGTISNTGLYTAPLVAGSFVVRATSVVDPRRSAESTATVEVASVSITPSPGPAILDGQTAQLTARVEGTSNRGVAWSVVTANGGTVSSSGLYTAPGTAGSYVVRAAAAADPRKFAEVTVTVRSIAVAIDPQSVTLRGGDRQQFTAAVQNTDNGEVIWSVRTAGGGTITSGGLYTAPSTPGTVTVRATSAADTSKFAEVNVNVYTLTISPASVSLITGATQQFTANMLGTPQNGLNWSVRPAAGGTVSSSGLYTASEEPGTYTVRATAVSFPTKFVEATVTVTEVGVVFSPSSAIVAQGATQACTATVSGVPVGSDTGVTWSVVTANGGSFSGSTYTAPLAAGTYTVRATSKADPRKFAEGIITVPAVAIAVTPTAVTMFESTHQIFTATVTGTVNTAVAYSVVSPGGGSITQAGDYTSPGAAGTYTVRATSTADPSKTADATVTVELVSVNVSPTSANMDQGATQQFTSTIAGTANTTANWSVSGGSISGSALYTAPASAGTYSVTATSTADSRKSAQATVTVPSVAIGISPASVTLFRSAGQAFTSTVTGTVNQAVTYAVVSQGGGTISTAGAYTAPAAAGVYTVRVTSAADPTKSADATVTVFTISLTPPSVTMAAGSTQQFTGTLNGTSQNGIDWSATGGSITSAGLYTAPTTPGTQTVRATSASFPTAYEESTVTVTTAAVSASTSTVVSSPASIVADGSTTSTITVTLKDAYGNPVNGKTVTLAKNSGSSTITTLGGTTDSGGQATFTVKDTVAESTTYTATDTTDNNLAITATASVTFVAGAVSAPTSTVAASPVSVVADGTTSAVTVTLKDVNGNPVGGKTVTLGKNGGSSTITTVSGTTNASGQASFTVSDTVAESSTYTATDATDSIAITQTASVTFVSGPVSASASTVVASPASIVADGSTTSAITVTLRDANGNPVAGKTVTLAKNGGSSTITTVNGTSNAAGQASFTVKDTVAESTVYTATDATDSIVVTPTATVTFQPGTATHYIVTSNASSAIAGNSVTITAQRADVNNNPVGTSGVSVSWSKTGTGGSFVSPTSATNSSGIATVTFTTHTVSGTVHTVTATDTPGLTGTSGSITTIPGPANATQSTLTPSSAAITANGTAAQVLTVTAKDTNGNSLTAGGSTVTITRQSGTGTIGSVTDNGNGTYTATVTAPTIAGSGVFVASLGGLAVGSPAQSTVTYVPDSADAAQSMLTPSSAGITANGTATQVLTVTARDVNGNTLTAGGSTVTITRQSGTGTIGSVTDNGNGTYTATVTSPTATGSGVFVATLGGAAVKSGGGTQTQSTITYVPGAADATQSTLTPSSASITANGTATQVLTVTARDANGNFLAAGGSTVTITKQSGTGTIGSVTDAGNGTYTATVTSPTATGSGVFVATLGGSAVKSGTGSQTQVTVTYAPGAVDAAQSTLTPTSAAITADGTSTQVLTVTARDANGNNVGAGGATVVIDFVAAKMSFKQGSGSLGSVTDNGNGTYTAILTSPTSAGFDQFLASLNGGQVKSGSASQTVATVTYVPGAADAAQSTLSPTSASITADGTSEQLLTVTAYDANGNAVGTGGSTVAITRQSGTGTIGSVTDNGDGTYTAKVTSPVATGSGVFVATLGGSAVKSGSASQTQATVTYIPGAVDATQTTLTPTSASITADGSSTQLLTVTARDVNGNLLTAGGSTVTITKQSGTGTIGSVTDVGNGTYTATVTAPTATGSGVFVATLGGSSQVKSGGGTQTQATVTYIPGAADATQSTLTPTSAAITANGTSTQVLTVTAKDANGNFLTAGGSTVTITKQSGTGTIGSVTDVGNGTYTATVTSPTTTGSGVFVATLGGLQVRSGTGSQTQSTITYVPGAADATQSTLTPTSAAITANGTATQVLTVTAKDANGNTLTAGGLTVTITKQSGTGTIGSVTDVGNGTYTATVTSPTATGSGVFVATLGGSQVKSGGGTQTQSTITYIPGAADATQSTLTPTSASITANGTSTQALTVTARDANGNFLTAGGSTVTITKQSGTGTIGSVTDVGNGTYTATVTSPTATGSGMFVATLGGLQVRSGTGSQTQSTITYVPGAADATQSTLTPTSASITANGTATQVLTVTARDANGNFLTAGGSTVTITKQSGTGTIGSVADIGNGTYTATVTSPTATGSGVFVATLGGSQVKSGGGTQTQSTITYIPGAADATQSTLTPTSAAITANGTATQVLTVMAKDANGNLLTAGGSTVTITKQSGTGTIGSVTDVGNGTYTATVTAPTATGSGVFVATLGGSQVKSGGGTQTQATVTYIPGAADATQSTLTPTSASITANGTSTQVLTVTAKDANGNFLTAGGSTVTITKQSGTGTIGSVTDVGNGTYTATVTAPTATGSGVFVATLGGLQVRSGTGSQTQSTITYIPGAADATQSTLTPTSASITANGTSTQVLTVTARDANGNFLTAGGSTVTITKQSGTGTIGSVTDVGNGTYTATVTSPTATGSGVFVATLGGSQVKSGGGTQTQATITYIPGAADATQSTLTPTSASITANGTATQVLTVTAKDVNGNSLTAGGSTVTITKQSGTGTVGSVTDVGNGTYTATVTAPTATGSGVFVATLGGSQVKSGGGTQTQSTITYIPGAADATQSTLTPTTASITANGTSTQVLTVTAKDANGNFLTAGGSTVAITKQSGTGTIGSVTDVGNGTYTATMTSPTATGSGVFVATLGGSQVKSGGGTQTQSTITYIPGAADATQSTLTPTSASITANGTATQMLTVTAKDVNGNSLTAGGSTVTITKQSGTGTIGSVTDVGNGTYTATVTSPTATGSGVFVATLGGSQVKSGGGTQTQATVTYVPGAADATQSTLTPTSASITANGTATQVLTVTAKDANGNTLTSGGSTVTITKQSGTGTIGSVTNVGNGTYTATVTAPTATGSGVFVATLGGAQVKSGTGSQTQSTITYIPGAADATQSTLTPTSASITADGSSTQVLTVTAKDANGNLLTAGGSTVTITKQSGTGTIGSVTDVGNGTYTATVTSPTATGSGVFVATLGGSQVKSGTGSQTQATVTYVAGSAAKYIVTSSVQGLNNYVAPDVNLTITAQLADANNNAVSTSGKVVTWSKTGSGGSFSSPTSTTNSSGIATVTFTTTGSTAGTTHTVTGTDNTSLTGSTGNIYVETHNAFQDFSSSGTFTVPGGVTAVLVELWGGGGSGGDQDLGSGGGGGGGYLRSSVNVSSGANISVTVGAAGAKNVNCNNDGGAGGSSTWNGGALSAGGGGGGAIRFHGGNGGTGGTITSGTYGYAGSNGVNGVAGVSDGAGGKSGSFNYYGSSPTYGNGTAGNSCTDGQPGHVKISWVELPP